MGERHDTVGAGLAREGVDSGDERLKDSGAGTGYFCGCSSRKFPNASNAGKVTGSFAELLATGWEA